VSGGIKEILRTKEFPGVCVRGARKGKAFDDIDPKYQVCDTGGGLREDGKLAAVGSATMKGIGKERARARERAYQKRIEGMNKAIRDQGGQRSKNLKLTHSIPVELYHGKIRETGDAHFWDDPKNRDQATSCKVKDA
jgi:hypothetical protein